MNSLLAGYHRKKKNWIRIYLQCWSQSTLANTTWFLSGYSSLITLEASSKIGCSIWLKRHLWKGKRLQNINMKYFGWWLTEHFNIWGEKKKERKTTTEQTEHILVIMPVTDWIKVVSKVTSRTQEGKKTIQGVSLIYQLKKQH